MCPECEASVVVPPPRVQAGTTLGNFLILEKIGRGGMGDVFRANQTTMDRVVALKVLPLALTRKQHIVDRFLHEMRMSARLEHPNIVTAFEAGEDNGYYYLAMSYVDGEDLSTRLKREGPIVEDLALLITGQVANGLAYAWREFRILHRDIKPANIMLDRNGTAKLMDMGISKSLTDEADLELTVTGTLVGTLHYMSPEQAKSGVDLDFRADLYSLGATLYYLVTGTKAFTGRDAVEVITQHSLAPFPDPRERNPKVSERCARLLEIMMAKDREERHGSWEELIDDIDRVRRGQRPRGDVSSGSGSGSGSKTGERGTTRPGSASSLELRIVPHRKQAPTESESAAEEPPEGTPNSDTASDSTASTAGTGSSLPPVAKVPGKAAPPVFRPSRARLLVHSVRQRGGKLVAFLLLLGVLAAAVYGAVSLLGGQGDLFEDLISRFRSSAEPAPPPSDPPDAPDGGETTPGPGTPDGGETPVVPGPDGGVDPLPRPVVNGHEAARKAAVELADGFVDHLLRGDRAAMLQFLEKAEKDAQRPRLKQLVRQLRLLNQRYQRVPQLLMQTFEAQRGTRVTVQLKDRPLLLHVLQVEAGVVSGRKMRPNYNVPLGEVSFSLDDLSATELLLRLNELGNDPEIALYTGLTHLAAGQRQQARDAFLMLPREVRDALKRRQRPDG